MLIGKPEAWPDDTKIIRFLDKVGYEASISNDRPTFMMGSIARYINMEKQRIGGIADDWENSVQLNEIESRNCDAPLISSWCAYPKTEEELYMLRKSTASENGECKNFSIVSTVGKVQQMIKSQIIKNQNWRLFHGEIIYYSCKDRFETGDFWHYKDRGSLFCFAEAFHKRNLYKNQNEYRFLLYSPTTSDMADQESHVFDLEDTSYITEKYEYTPMKVIPIDERV